MDTQEIKKMKKSSTDIFTAMVKHLYREGLEVYRERKEYDFLISLLLDQDKVDSYILLVIKKLSKSFDENMKKNGRNERLKYVNTDKVLSAIRISHFKASFVCLTKE